MNLSKEQIAEIAEKIWKEIDIGDFDKKEYFEKWLTEKFGAKEESWPKEGDTIFLINSDGTVFGTEWNGKEPDLRAQSIGNIYRTKEEAEARVSLLRHINKFKRPEGGEMQYSLGLDFGSDKFYWRELMATNSIISKADFNSGLIMPLSSTEEDRAERIDLLKKCFS